MLDNRTSRRLTGFAALSSVYLLGYLVLDSATRTFQTLPGVSPWYPPNALSLAVLLVFGARMFPLVLLASILSNTLIWELKIGPFHTVLLAAIPALGYTAASVLLRRVLGLEPRLRSTRQSILFIASSLILPVPIAAAQAYESLQARIIAVQQYQDAVTQYWVGDVVGILTLVPFLTVVLIPSIRSLLRKAESEMQGSIVSSGKHGLPPLGEILAIAGATLLLGWTILDLELLGSPPLVYPLFLPLIWSAMRFGMTGAASANLGIGVTSMLFLSSGGAAPIEISGLQLFICLLSATGLALGAVVSQERAAEEALIESEERYRRVFESSSECMLVLNEDYRIIDVNAAASLLFEYSERELKAADPASLIGANYRKYFKQFLLRALAGESLNLRLQCVKNSGELFEASVATTHIPISGAVRVLVLVRDITQEVRMLEVLEERVKQRTRDLRALLSASGAVAKYPDLAMSVPEVLRAMASTLPVEASRIYIYKPDGLVHLASFDPPDVRWCHRSLSQSEVKDLARKTGFRLDLASASHPPGPADRREDSEEIHAPVALRSHSASALLTASAHEFGLLRVIFPSDLETNEDTGRLVSAFADQLSLALQNARLKEENAGRLDEAIRRRRVSESLARIIQAVNQDMSVNELLQAIVEQAALALEPDAVALFQKDPGEGGLVIQASTGLPEDFRTVSGLPAEFGAVGRAVISNRPVLLTDLRNSLAEDVQQPAARAHLAVFEWIFNSYDTILSIPLQVRGETYGGISLYYRDRPELGQEQVDLAAAFGAQAALALENSRLSDQSRRLAALQERQRIARELHDSVSQSLYGLSLGARTAQTLSEGRGRDLEQALDYVLELADSALKEMRGLIYELRPEGLREQGLTAALHQLAASLGGRHSVDIRLQIQESLELDPSLEEAIFRITQEALQNAVRHSGATTIEILLTERDSSMHLEVRDDGSGFDPDSVPSGHFGLSTMRERVEQLGGQLTVASQPDQGTTIRAVLALSVPAPDRI